MKNINFSKYHALGNDYVVINPNISQLSLTKNIIRLICHRNYGIGADGILYGPIFENDLPILRIYNPDGSEAEKSGNGIRIFSKYLFDKGYEREEFTIKTAGGNVTVKYLDNKAELIQVDMGEVTFACSEIPVISEKCEMVNEPIIVNCRTFNITCVSIGNPHCVIAVEDLSKQLAAEYGPYIENHMIFPNRINVQFMQLIDRNNINIQIWERGAGYTLASGSSSSAAASVAKKLGLVDDDVNVHMPGGVIKIHFAEDGHVHMTGTVMPVAQGEYYLPDDCIVDQMATLFI